MQILGGSGSGSSYWVPAAHKETWILFHSAGFSLALVPVDSWESELADGSSFCLLNQHIF